MLSPNETGPDPPEAMPFPPGTSLGNYTLQDRIGHGAMGAVYRAEHTLLRKAVAIKVMAAPLLDNPDARQRFLREGRTAAALKHPNVVDVTDVGVSGTTPFLVMELLDGEDLEAFLERRKHLEEWEVAELIVPIVAALASAHEQGVVHRDLKPSNIFVARDSDGELTPKVLDFGICKLVHPLEGPDPRATPFNQLMGSPSYLSPEALKGEGDVSNSCDQYSLGVVLYECVTGRKPFLGPSLFSLLTAILTGEFARPKESRPDVSSALEDIILRAMNAEPESRFKDMRELGRALLEVAGPRTRLLWGPAFGHSEASGGLLAVNSLVELSIGPPHRVSRIAQSWHSARSNHLAWTVVVVIMVYLVTGFRSTWEAPTASAMNADPVSPLPVQVPSIAVSVAAPASAEPVPQPAAINVMRGPDESGAASPVAAPAVDAISGEAREPQRKKRTGRATLRGSKPSSKPRAQRVPSSEARATLGPGEPERATSELDEGSSGASLANEAPIFE
jgi:eukaryotic-like serine/threonine-protein kinase